MSADEFLAEEGARVANWLGGLLTRGLALPDGLTVDQRAHQMDAARAAAAELAGAHWGHESAGIEARVQAAQFVSAHAAAMEWQAEANRRDLPPHARATAQRLARQLMALTTAQLNGLCRLRAEQRKDRDEAARAAARQTAAEAKARSADRRALVAEMEQMLKAVPDRDEMAELAATEEPPDPPPVPGSAGTPRCRSGDAGGFAEASGAGVPATPEPVGAGVPAPPPDPTPPLNRRQRRALERLRRKEKVREGVG